MVLSPSGVIRTKQIEDALPSEFSLLISLMPFEDMLSVNNFPYLSFFLLPINAHFPPSGGPGLWSLRWPSCHCLWRSVRIWGALKTALFPEVENIDFIDVRVLSGYAEHGVETDFLILSDGLSEVCGLSGADSDAGRARDQRLGIVLFR